MHLIQYDRAAADEQERHRQHAEALAAVADMAYAATCLSDASWVLFARRLRDAIVAEQVRREREYLKGFRSAAWGALS